MPDKEMEIIEYIDNAIKRLEYLKKIYLRGDISLNKAQVRAIYYLESRAKWIAEDM